MTPPDQKNLADIAAALGCIPQGVFLLTAWHEDQRTGMLASWVQQVSFHPPMVAVAVAKGRPIMPLISESRYFGLCQLPANDKIITHKFANGFAPGEDPFLGLALLNGAHGHVPILAAALAYLECEVTRHMDAEGDHDVIIGTVVSGRYLGGEPGIHLRVNGMKY